MLAIKGVYENGEIELKEKPDTNGRIPVIVTFLDEIDDKETKKLDLDKFSFNRSRTILKDYKGSLSDALIEERRSHL